MFRTRHGFTVPELIVVMVVIGILATIVLVTYGNVQARARDNQRQVDVETIAHYLENEFQKDGQYPSIATMTGSVSGVQAVLNNISPNVLAAPGITAGTNSITDYSAAAPTVSQFGYWTPNKVPDCTTNYTVATCATFILAYRKETDSSVVVVCGRGSNINTAKAIFAGANGLVGFNSASCSNF